MLVPSSMDTYFFDYETFYSDEYTLTKLDPPSYILHDLFEATCLGVAKNTDPPFIVDGPDIPAFLNQMPRDVAVVSHDALFDMCICSWRFGYVPTTSRRSSITSSIGNTSRSFWVRTRVFD